jgi:hypothetical protein
MFLVLRLREALGSRAILENRICNDDRSETKFSKHSLIRIKDAKDNPKRQKKKKTKKNLVIKKI